MKVKRRMLTVNFLVAMAVLLVPAASAHAQANKERPLDQSASKREPKHDLDHLKSKLEQLQSLVETQQRALAEMQQRLDRVEKTARAATLISSRKTDDPMPEPPVALFETEQVPKSAPPAQDKPKVQDKKTTAGWDSKSHAFLRSEDGSFETQITGYAQLDFRGYQSGDHPPNTLLIRRARLAVEGKLERYFDFKVEGDFADSSSTLLRDFYVNINRIDEFQLRFGQFRVPISQEEIRRDQLQDFVERSMVNNLVPSRSPGVMASGVINKGVFEYQIGAFNGKGLLAANSTGTPETAMRLRFNPWKHSREFLSKGFIFGGAFTQGRAGGGTSVRGQTESRSFIFFTPDTINGKYIRANGEVTWMLGPAAIRAEYDQTNQRRDGLGPGGRNLPGVVAKGYMAQMTYVLTGEEKPESSAVSPKNNLFGDGNGKQGFGAWELKARYSNLQIADGTPKSNRAGSFYFGTNWYMNRYVRYMLDLGFERFKDPARSPRPGDKNFFVVLSRVQVAF